MTPDAHMVETLRLRTAAMHRVSRSNDLLRRENDDLRARLARVEALAKDEPLFVYGIRADITKTPACRGGIIRHQPGTDGRGSSGCPGDNLTDWFDRLRAVLDGTP